MDTTQFDRITRALSHGSPRRTIVGLLVGGLLGQSTRTAIDAKGRKRTAASEGKKGKTIDLCLNGETLTVKKSKKGKLLKQGATQGACPA